MNTARRCRALLALACCAAAGLSLPKCARTEFAKVGANQPDARTHLIGDGLGKLPANVKAEKGRVTLFADFERPTDDGVTVYFVNRTGKALILEHQDGDLYIKLEYESAPNQWTRAQTHIPGKCGNSYWPRFKIEDESFATQVGYFPRTGAKANVRYATYGQSVQVVSNQTVGFVKEEDIRKAANDFLAIEGGTLVFVSKVARGELQMKHEWASAKSMRKAAIRELSSERFPAREAERILWAIASGSDEDYAKEAAFVLERMKKKD